MIRALLTGVAVLAPAFGATAQVAAPPPAAVDSGPYAEFLRAGAARYWPSQTAAEGAKPSLLLQSPFPSVGPPPDAPWSPPEFSREGEAFVAHVPAPEGSLYFGAGVWGTLPPRVAVDGGAPPWIMIVRPGLPVLGVLADTTAPCEIECGAGLTIRAASEFPVLQTLSDDAPAAVGSLALLTGWMDLPPAWALGYQHADPSLTDAESLLAAAKRLRTEGLPADALWASGPPETRAGSAQALAALGFHLMTRVPAEFQGTAGAGMDVSGHPADEPRDRPAPDFTRLAARSAWGDTLEFSAGAVGFEVVPVPPGPASVFQADADLGGPAGMERYGPVYPALAARAAREAFARAESVVRPVLTTAAPAPGGQRYAATWVPAAGNDQAALRDSLRRLQVQSMSARFLAGMDIPGVDPESDGAALARWFGVAALMPMLRANPAAGDTCAPWDFGPATLDTARRALDRRARLTPFLYTRAFSAFRFDEPIVRPAWTLDPADPSLRESPMLFMLGSEVLVDAREAAELPAAVRDWPEFDPQPGLPRLHLRPGAMIPAGPVRQHAGESPLDPLELVVALDAAGQAQGMLYEDDGEGFDYTRNLGRIAYYAAQRTDKDVLVKMVRLDGGWPMAKRPLIVHVLLPGGGAATGEFRDALDTHVTLP